MSEDLCFKSAKELAALLQSRQLSSLELMESLLARVKRLDGRLGAFLSFDEEDVLKQAKAADLRRENHQTLSPYDGIPVSIKDIIAVKDQSLTCASRMLEKYVSPYDATVIEKLRSRGMILFGRMNMDEFAMGSSTETSAYKKTVNPWNMSCVPGGSSGGSACGVAAGETVFALGTDTGGSVRQPAAFCGITGLKPTYGRVSRYGVVAFASSLDQVGPMARSVDDAAVLLEMIAGWDAHDSTSVQLPVGTYEKEAQAAGPWRLGVPWAFYDQGLDDEMKKSVLSAIDFYRDQGCEICDIDLPHAPLGIAVYYVIATAEAASNLARFDGVRYGHRSTQTTNARDLYYLSRGEGFGDEVKRRIILGTAVLSSGYHDAYYTRAQKVRTLIRGDYDRAFQSVDAVLLPTTPTPAFAIGGKVQSPLEMYLNDIYTVSANLAGVPSISIPCGFSSDGLPLGFQIVGKPYGEGEMMAIANRFQKAHDYHLRHPGL